MDVHSLTLEVVLHIHPLREERLLTLNLSLTHVHTGNICDITPGLEASHGPTYSLTQANKT